MSEAARVTTGSVNNGAARRIPAKHAEELAWGVLMPGLDGISVPEWLREPLRGGLASVCLFGSNVPTPSAAGRLCAELRSLAPDLVIAIDEEGGDVTRLHAADGSPVPGNAALGWLASPRSGQGDARAIARACAEQVGSDLSRVGINLCLAPVLDVSSEPRNPVIGTRSFGADPLLVSVLGRATIDGLHARGIAACAKHFPGHGDTTVDSHVGLPTVHADAETLDRRELIPFRGVLDIVDAVMTAHLLVPALGEGIASLSRWSSEMLRRDGFEGVIITDALGMAAVSGDDIGPAVVAALAAGADLCCLDSPLQRDAHRTFRQAVAAITTALRDGLLDADALRRSASRTRAMARRMGSASSGKTLPAPDVGLQAARAAVTSPTGVPPLPQGEAIGFIDLRRQVNHAAGANGHVLRDALSGHFHLRNLDPVGPIGDIPSILDSVDGLALVVQTRSAISDSDEAELLSAVLARRPDAIVVHCGISAAAPVSGHLVLAHGVSRATSMAVAELLSGGR